MKVYGAYWRDCWEGGYDALFDSYEKAYQFCRVQAKRHNKWERRYNKRKNKENIMLLFDQHFFTTNNQDRSWTVQEIQIR